MILDRLMDKLFSYGSWLYYRSWKIWELKIALLTIAVAFLILLRCLTVWRRRKSRARITSTNQGSEGSSVGVHRGKWIKRTVIAAIVIAALIDFGIFCYRRPKPTNNFYLRSHQTGKLIGPISLPRGHLLPPMDEQTYMSADPTETELEVRSRLLRCHVRATLTNLPFSEALKHILDVYGIRDYRIEVADESKLPRISIDVKGVPLYDVLCMLASQTKLRIIIEDDTIIFTEERFQ